MNVSRIVMNLWCIILYPVLLLIDLHFGYEIVNDAVPGFSFQNVEKSAYITIIIVWWALILCVAIIYILTNNKFQKSTHKTPLLSLFVLISIFLIILTSYIQTEFFYASDIIPFIQILFDNSRSFVMILCFSFSILILLSLYQQINCEYLWFDHNHLRTEDTQKSDISIKWIIYFISNELLSIYCFYYVDEYCLNAMFVFINRFWLFVTPILYYIIPINATHDLYHHKKQLKVWIFLLGLIKLWSVLWKFGLKYYINYNINTMVVYFGGFIQFVSLGFLPILINKYKKYNNNIQDLLWFNNNNFQPFSLYLTQCMALENLLFFLEVMQYKNCIISKMNDMLNKGYMLAFDDDNFSYLLALNPTLRITSIQRANIDEINILRIRNDISYFYEKYIKINYDDESNYLHTSFIMNDERERILKILYLSNDLGDEIKDNLQIICIFDETLKKINYILQLLYNTYIESQS